jgi:protein SCO1/2
MMNFIFTRCPVATMCPASTIEDDGNPAPRGRRRRAKNIEFVSITLDPAYDTPGVLKEYAVLRGSIRRIFPFSPGPDAAIKDLLDAVWRDRGA